MVIPFSNETFRGDSVRICLRLMMVAAVLWTASCATKPRLNTTDGSMVGASGDGQVRVDSQEIEKRIRSEYRQWQGTPHSLGGSGRGGIDCSGFVKVVLKKLFDVEMPRTTKNQVKKGVPISRDELRAGDLVFFKPPTYPRHVGIFLSGTEFVHASKSNGVMISELSPDYWGKYYWTGRRVLPDARP